MDVTGVLAVRLDPGQLQLRPDLNAAPSQAVLPQAVRPAGASESAHQTGYQRRQNSARDSVELHRREEDAEPKMIPSLPEFKFRVAGTPQEEEFPVLPNARATEVIRRFDEIAKGDLNPALDDHEPLDITA